MDTITVTTTLDFEQTRGIVYREVKRKQMFNRDNEDLTHCLAYILCRIEESKTFDELEQVTTAIYRESLEEFLQYVMTH